jgi:ribosome maturation factor RimP
MADIARITEVIEPEAKALGFDLVRVKIFGKAEAGARLDATSTSQCRRQWHRY